METRSPSAERILSVSLDRVSLSCWVPLRPGVSPGIPGPLSGHLVPPCPALGLASTIGTLFFLLCTEVGEGWEAGDPGRAEGPCLS